MRVPEMLRHPLRAVLRAYFTRKWGPPEKWTQVIEWPTRFGPAVALQYVDPATGEVWHAPAGSPLPEPWRPMPPGWTYIGHVDDHMRGQS
jgi:hypothetical protein